MEHLDQSDEGESRPRQFFEAFRRRWVIVVVCVAVAPVAALAVSLLQPKVYKSTASLLLADPAFDQRVTGEATTESSAQTERRSATTLGLLQQRTVAHGAALRAGVPTDEVEDAVDVTTSPGSDVFLVEASAGSPKAAAALANAYATTFVRQRERAADASLRQALTAVDERKDAVAANGEMERLQSYLVQRANQLKIQLALRSGDVSITDPATSPDAPSSPNTKLNIALGIVVGLGLAAALVAVLEATDRRVRSVEEIEEIFGSPILTTIPRLNDEELEMLPPQVFDNAAMLRASLSYFDVGPSLRQVMITSGTKSEGKTTIAWLLAVTSALNGARVLLLDCDLRSPFAAKRAGVASRPGLSEWLSGSADLHQVSSAASPPSGIQLGDRMFALDVIPGGGVPPNPAELIDSQRMGELLDLSGSTYDFVVIDAPPLMAVPDAIPLASRVDGVVVVARIDHALKRAVRDLRQRLDGLDARVLGVVANSVPRRADQYGYEYGDESVLAASNSTRRMTDGQRSINAEILEAGSG